MGGTFQPDHMKGDEKVFGDGTFWLKNVTVSGGEYSGCNLVLGCSAVGVVEHIEVHYGVMAHFYTGFWKPVMCALRGDSLLMIQQRKSALLRSVQESFALFRRCAAIS